MRRIIIALAAVIGATLGSAILSAGTAGADNGDGRPGCANGEICLWYNTDSAIEKQFWWTNWRHVDNNFMCNCFGGYFQTSENVHDNVHDITNRDTQCWVLVGDFNGVSWEWQEFSNDGLRHVLNQQVINQNDAHVRSHNPGCG